MNKINVIRDLLVSLKNGYSNKNKYAYCKLNSFCISVLWQLYKEELIYDFSVEPENSKIKIKLKYFKNKPLITNLQLISKPSLVNFSNFEELRLFYKKYDYFFVATSRGVLSSKQLLHEMPIGGQLLFGLKIYLPMAAKSWFFFKKSLDRTPFQCVVIRFVFHLLFLFQL